MSLIIRYQYDTYLHRVEQMIGRIDMSDFASFDESEIELLRKVSEQESQIQNR
ncbi:MAG: hypothetical protein H6615_05180 [Ignavibacteria bacterium]|nr:hypothetical protein [Ignavibacteria bacterium]